MTHDISREIQSSGLTFAWIFWRTVCISVILPNGSCQNGGNKLHEATRKTGIMVAVMVRLDTLHRVFSISVKKGAFQATQWRPP